jgi:cellulose synthase/poly-beta-1,6-N-acetylglucosamine synthase-like glycosyltransferase
MSGLGSVQVIIPYYKEFEYFSQALSSVTSQDYQDFSILVIDDGTRDIRVTDLINSLNDNRITLIQNDRNIGLAANFEFARQSASADYLVFLGQDDLLEPNYISTVLPWISSSPNIAIAQPGVNVINSAGKQFRPATDAVKRILLGTAWSLGQKKLLGGVEGSILSGRRALALLLVGDFLYFPTLMWKASSMVRFDVSREITLDYQMLIDVLGNRNDLLLIKKISANYRRHARSASMNPERKIDRLLEERDLHLSFSKHSVIVNSKALRLINYIRFTHRLHALQTAASAFLHFDWLTMIRALRCVG